MGDKDYEGANGNDKRVARKGRRKIKRVSETEFEKERCHIGFIGL